MEVTQTNRDISQLSNNFRLKVIDFLKEVGDIIFITEGFRSKERQSFLWSQGRKSPYKDKSEVTWVKHSNHQDGNAIDIAFKGNDLYPSEHSKWAEIGLIAKKYGIDWGFDLWKIDKVHFQDNLKPYIPVIIEKMENKKEIMQFGKLVTRNGFTYPSSIWGIPVRLAKTKSKKLLGIAKVKGYLPGCKKDEILIFNNTFKYGQDGLYEVIMHEFSHFIYHRHLDNGEVTKMMFDDGKSFWEQLSKFIPSYITVYGGTGPAEDFAELIGCSHYISNKIELPSKYNLNDQVKFKYEIAIKLYLSGLKKHLETLENT